MSASSEAASRGMPSQVWRAGQDRRLALIAGAAPADCRRVLDVGCGVGLYALRLAEAGAVAFGTEVEWPRALDAHRRGLAVVAAAAEALPYPDGTFDLALSHEVLEHVADDAAAVGEMLRVLRPGGRAIVFVPNRGWPFETHGVFWRGRYHFGNQPLVNYAPDPVRNRLAPHVRVYSVGGLRRLFDGQPARIILHRQIFPGYDNMAARRPMFGRWVRRISYAIEGTPLEAFGLSHFLVAERLPYDSGAGRGPLVNSRHPAPTPVAAHDHR